MSWSSIVLFPLLAVGSCRPVETSACSSPVEFDDVKEHSDKNQPFDGQIWPIGVIVGGAVVVSILLLSFTCHMRKRVKARGESAKAKGPSEPTENAPSSESVIEVESPPNSAPLPKYDAQGPHREHLQDPSKPALTYAP